MEKIKIYRQIKVGKVRYKEAVECEKIIDDNLDIAENETEYED